MMNALARTVKMVFAAVFLAARPEFSFRLSGTLPGAREGVSLSAIFDSRREISSAIESA